MAVQKEISDQISIKQMILLMETGADIYPMGGTKIEKGKSFIEPSWICRIISKGPSNMYKLVKISSPTQLCRTSGRADFREQTITSILSMIYFIYSG